jgi:hypothetical protein
MVDTIPLLVDDVAWEVADESKPLDPEELATLDSRLLICACT